MEKIPLKLMRFFVSLSSSERQDMWLFFSEDHDAANLCCDGLVNPIYLQCLIEKEKGK